MAICPFQYCYEDTESPFLPAVANVTVLETLCEVAAIGKEICVEAVEMDIVLH